MFSLSKLITLALIVLAVWYGFKWLQQVNAARAHRAARHARRESGGAGAAPVPTEDMTKCSVCGIYIPARGAPPCPLAECPLRR